MSWETKDSGERESFDSGMVRDTQDGKPRFDLLIPQNIPFGEQILTRFAALMERGANKYGERNWEKGDSQVELERAIASALRHMMQWVAGETDEDHAVAVFFNIMQAETLRYKLSQTNEEQEASSGLIYYDNFNMLLDNGCRERCTSHPLMYCAKEKGHSFKHNHDSHWWGEENESGLRPR